MPRAERILGFASWVADALDTLAVVAALIASYHAVRLLAEHMDAVGALALLLEAFGVLHYLYAVPREKPPRTAMEVAGYLVFRVAVVVLVSAPLIVAAYRFPGQIPPTALVYFAVALWLVFASAFIHAGRVAYGIIARVRKACRKTG